MPTTRGRRQRRRRATALVVDLSSIRAQRRREQAEDRVRGAMEDNRAELSRLFSTGLITQKARAGGTLLAHRLLRTADLFARLDEPARGTTHGAEARAEEVFAPDGDGRGRRS